MAAKGWKEKIAVGADPAGKVAELKKVETIDEMLDRYLKDSPPASASWRGEVERIFRKDVRPAIGHLKLHEVDHRAILAIVNAVKDRGAGIAANRTLAAIRKAFNWAVAERHMDASPAAGIAPRAKETVRDRALAKSEIRSFWTGMDETGMTSGVKLALRIAMATGARIGEIVGARWARSTSIRPNGVSRPSGPRTARSTSCRCHRWRWSCSSRRWRYPERTGNSSPMFPPSKAAAPPGSDPHALAHAMRRDAPVLGLDDDPATPHDIRRTVASEIAGMGIAENVVARLLNHRHRSRQDHHRARLYRAFIRRREAPCSRSLGAAATRRLSKAQPPPAM